MVDFEQLWEDVKHLGEEELNIVVDAIRDATNQFAPQVVQAARTAVANAAELPITGVEKKEAAFKEIGDNLAAQGILVGIQVGVGMIYKMIETAYRWFMAEIAENPGSPQTGGPIGTE